MGKERKTTAAVEYLPPEDSPNGQLGLFRDLPELEAETLRQLPAVLSDSKGDPYSGKILMGDAEKVKRIMECLALGAGINETSRRCHVHKRSVRNVQEAMSAAGKLEPLKARMRGQLGALVTLSLDDLLDRIEQGEWMPPNVLAITAGIGIDKLGVLEASMGLGDGDEASKRAAREEREALEARLRQVALGAGDPGPGDSESTD